MSYITAQELNEIAGITGDDINFDAIITRAQKELDTRLGKTFAGTETNYILIKRALAFLTAYYVRLERKEIEYAKETIKEYDRLIKILAMDNEPEKQEYWEPTMKFVNQQDLVS